MGNYIGEEAGRKKKRGKIEGEIGYKKKRRGRVEKSEKVLRHNRKIKDKKKIEERKRGMRGRGRKNLK
jgi:hypothetical protein